MNNAGNIPKDRQQDIQPKLPAEADCEEYSHRREQNRKEKPEQIGHHTLIGENSGSISIRVFTTSCELPARFRRIIRP
jgi:hypothetical protein